jgi:hypothetical protein
MIHEVGRALYPCVGQLAYLLTVKPVPSSAVELLVEIKDELGVDEVDEGVAHVAGVVVVDGQVEEVYFHFVVSADLFEQHLFGILIWNVANHQRCPAVQLDLSNKGSTLSSTILYSFTSYPETLRFFRVES